MHAPSCDALAGTYRPACSEAVDGVRRRAELLRPPFDHKAVHAGATRPSRFIDPYRSAHCAPEAPARRRPCRLYCRAAPHVRMHDSSNATAVESREDIAMESRFSRPLERVVQACGCEMMPLITCLN
eukprot:6153082-Prymnesium_polylepis.1